MKAGRITLSDRAAAGVYEDCSGPLIDKLLREWLGPEVIVETAVIPDEQPLIEQTLKEFADQRQCQLIITTGGTGIGPRDVTPEATRAVLHKELPGFGEVMRRGSYATVKTALLSRATAGVRGRTFILNLPGSPQAAQECLAMVCEAALAAVRHLQTDSRHPDEGAGNRR